VITSSEPLAAVGAVDCSPASVGAAGWAGAQAPSNTLRISSPARDDQIFVLLFISSSPLLKNIY
jgi:hypothetical protein